MEFSSYIVWNILLSLVVAPVLYGIRSNTTAYEEDTWKIGFKDPSSFVEFDNLNIDLVISWIMPEVEKNNRYNWIAVMIERLNNTKEISE
jgi:hypothetical protein